jgi:hypothetical protein
MATAQISVAGPSVELLPDVVVRRPSQLDLQVGAGGRRRIRFTTTIANLGVGVAELRPVKDDCDGNGDLEDDRIAIQRVYQDEDGSGDFDPSVDARWNDLTVGCFVFHARHEHWHFVNFARYRLVDPRTGGVVAVQAKVGFCLVDNYRWRPDVPGSPDQRYYSTCEVDEVQGSSPGWADVYAATLAAQWVDVTRLAVGRYCLIQRVDPADRIAESDDSNNVNRTPIRLRKGSAVRLRGSC